MHPFIMFFFCEEIVLSELKFIPKYKNHSTLKLIYEKISLHHIVDNARKIYITVIFLLIYRYRCVVFIYNE